MDFTAGTLRFWSGVGLFGPQSRPESNRGEPKHTPQKTGNIVNAGKYLSCIILVAVDVLQKLNPRPFVFPLETIQGLWLAAAIVKTLLVGFSLLRC